MAPAWALAARPLVLVFAAVAFLVTWVFDADVDSQAGAHATGVLVLITSAAFAVTLSAYRRRDRMAWAYALITLVFAVTTVANMVERPDGLKIAGYFTAAILTHFLRFILWGSGEVAPVTREILRRAEPDRSRRPHVHAG